MLWACLTVSLSPVTQSCLHRCSATAGCGYPSVGGPSEMHRVTGVYLGVQSPETFCVQWMSLPSSWRCHPSRTGEAKGWESSHDTFQPRPSVHCILQLLLQQCLLWLPPAPHISSPAHLACPGMFLSCHPHHISLERSLIRCLWHVPGACCWSTEVSSPWSGLWKHSPLSVPRLEFGGSALTNLPGDWSC